MSEPILTYAPPAPPRPGMLAAALWLNIVSVLASIAIIGGAAWCFTLIGSGRPPAFNREAVMVGTTFLVYGIASMVCAFFCIAGIRLRRWWLATRVFSVFPLSLFVPFGTIAGLFTYVVLGSPTIRAAYNHEPIRV